METGEAVGLAVNADGVVSVFDPILVRQVDGVLFSQGVDVLGIDHGDGVRILGCVLGGEMRCDGVVGVVDLDVYAFSLVVFSWPMSSIWLSISTLELKIVTLVPLELDDPHAQHADGHQRCNNSGASLLPRRELAHFPIFLSTIHRAALPNEVIKEGESPTRVVGISPSLVYRISNRFESCQTGSRNLVYSAIRRRVASID